MAVDDGVAFAGFDERADSRPVFSPSMAPAKSESGSVQSTDGIFDTLLSISDAAACQEETQTVPIFGDVLQGWTEGALGSYPTSRTHPRPCNAERRRSHRVGFPHFFDTERMAGE